MAIGVKMTFDDEGLKHLAETITKRLPEETNKSLFDYAVRTAKIMRKNATTDSLRPITNDRQLAAALIHAKKISKNSSVIKMPLGLVYLDSMKPHYVSLKRGRKIVDWTRRNFGSAQVSGRSRVRKGPRGGIRGSLYVIPHPFVQRSLHESRKILSNNLRKGITKAFKGTAS